jgi:hypothetical protein
MRFVTDHYAPNQTVTTRWAPNWTLDRGGVYVGGAWRFDLVDEGAFPAGIEFKFVLAPGRWMQGDNQFLSPAQQAGQHDYAAPHVAFALAPALTT